MDDSGSPQQAVLQVCPSKTQLKRQLFLKRSTNELSPLHRRHRRGCSREGSSSETSPPHPQAWGDPERPPVPSLLEAAWPAPAAPLSPEPRDPGSTVNISRSSLQSPSFGRAALCQAGLSSTSPVCAPVQPLLHGWDPPPHETLLNHLLPPAPCPQVPSPWGSPAWCHQPQATAAASAPKDMARSSPGPAARKETPAKCPQGPSPPWRKHC